MRELKASSYDFVLPAELIASKPANPPDSARLLVYDRKTDKISHHIFKDLLSFLDDYCLILNNTKVVKARIFGHKITGAKIELLLNKPLPNDMFLVFIRGKVKLEDRLIFDENLEALICGINDDGSRVVRFVQCGISLDASRVFEIFDKIGHMPLPPYINRADEKSDETDYQTLFAKHSGSVAAPTASLHFTPEMLADIQKKCTTAFLTLHVGAGTFKPVECENINEHKMHSEYFHIEDDTVKLIDSNSKILAVGTTATRTIEYYSRTKKINGECDLFLNPTNKPKRVDAILTNFHLPKSTLLMLVASFVGLEKALDLYKIAIDNKYRFYSYGDAMLIL